MKHCVKVLDTHTHIGKTCQLYILEVSMKTRKTKPSQIFPSREKGVSVSTFFQELKINFIALSWEPESLKLEEKEAQGKRE